MKWYVKQWTTGRYLKRTGVRYTRHKDVLTEGKWWAYHSKQLEFTHSKEDAHGFDREKHVINFIRKHNDLRAQYDKKEIYCVQE